MDIAKYKAQHQVIAQHIRQLRQFTREGIAEHAADIAALVIRMSSIIKLHLSSEERYLYPALQAAGRDLARTGKRFQDEMVQISNVYAGFSHKWNRGAVVARDPEGFRHDANRVLKPLFYRM